MKADFNNLGYIGYIGHSTARFSDEWYTPALYIESVRAVLREIDLDPFSSEAANEAIRAKRIFTLEDSGIGRKWSDTPVRVFINPPYGRATLRPAMDAFLSNGSSPR